MTASGGYRPPAYPYPPPAYPGFGGPAAGPRNGLGIAALLIAIAGLVTALSVVGGVVLGSVAVLLGVLGRGRAKRGEADNGGVAMAGIVLGALAVVAGIVCVFIYVGIWKSVGGDDYLSCMSRAGSDPVSQQRCTDRFRERFQDEFGTPPAPRAPSGSALDPGSAVMPA